MKHFSTSRNLKTFFNFFQPLPTFINFRRFPIWLVILSLALIASGCAGVSTRRQAAVEGRMHLKDLCERQGIRWQWDHVLQTAALQVDGTQARLLVGSDILLLGKEPVKLSAPVTIVQSSVMVPLDLKSQLTGKSLKEPAQTPAYFFRQLREIVVDAGHGGKDPGATGRTGLKEKGVVLDIAQKLRAILQGKGVKVTMTRDGDEFISLNERTEIASRSKADLFISIHANSSPASGVSGLEVFSLRDLGTIEKNEAQRKINHEIMFKHLSMSKNPSKVDEIVSDMLYTSKQSVSEALAPRLVAATSRLAKTQNRGEKRARFFVLRNTLIPALLVEVGFLSNAKEEKLLKTSSYRQKIAEGLAKSILDYADRPL